MRYIIKPFPDYSPGYTRLDIHYPSQEALLQTIDQKENESYLGQDLPTHIKLNLKIKPILISKTISATLKQGDTLLTTKDLYHLSGPEFIAGIELESDKCGSYFCDGNLRFFTDNQLENAQLITENNVVLYKRFLIQEMDIYQEDEETGKLTPFPYGGFFKPGTSKIEDIQQYYGCLFSSGEKLTITLKSAQQWLEAGYDVPNVPTLAQDIVEGKGTFILRQKGINFTYQSIAYEQIDPYSSIVTVHFCKKPF